MSVYVLFTVPKFDISLQSYTFTFGFHCSLMYTWFSVMRKILEQSVNTGSIGTVSSQILNSVHLTLVRKTDIIMLQGYAATCKICVRSKDFPALPSNKLEPYYTSLKAFLSCVALFANRKVQKSKEKRPKSGGSLRFVAGGHQDSAPRHMGEHVLYKCSCVESPGLKTAGQIHAHRQSICPVPSP